jgi:hypothetical protein
MQLLLNEEKEYSDEVFLFSKRGESKGLYLNTYIASTKTSTSTAERALRQTDARAIDLCC